MCAFKIPFIAWLIFICRLTFHANEIDIDIYRLSKFVSSRCSRSVFVDIPLFFMYLLVVRKAPVDNLIYQNEAILIISVRRGWFGGGWVTRDVNNQCR